MYAVIRGEAYFVCYTSADIRIYKLAHPGTRYEKGRWSKCANEQLGEKIMITSIIHKTARSERKREIFPQKSKRQSTGHMHPKL